MTDAAFDSRLTRLARKHRKMMAGGVSYRMTRDGLITAHPRVSLAPAFPTRTLALLVIGAFAFKALLLVALGDEPYTARLANLQVGSPVEQAGAWVMQADPATATIARVMRDIAA